MSEFLAEARILVRPDTTKFRAELEAALSVATKPITIPVVPVVASGISAATAATTQFTAAQSGAAAETQAVAAALEKETIAATQASVATKGLSASSAGLARGAGASALTLLGLRGATLAASGAFLAGTAAVVAFSKSLQSAADLETELNVFRVTAGATADEMNRVSAASKALGRDLTLPGVTAGDAAQTLTLLSKAGLNVRNSLGAVRGTLQLATAAQIDNAEATKLVVGALNSFELAGTNATRIADLFTGAAQASQGEITDMGTSLAQAAAVSKQFGVSIEDTITLLTELAQAGLSGGRAGTSLRVAFLRLVNPPAQAAAALKELNVQIRDAQGNLRPQIFTDIADALSGYTKAQRDATLATIFGSDAIRAAAIIGNKGAQSFLQTRDAISEVGLAQEQAAARTSGLQGDIENLSNQMSSLGLTFGNVAKGPVSSFVSALADTVSEMNTVADGAINLVSSIKDISNSVDDAVPILGAFDSHLSDIGKATSFINPLTGQLALAAKAASLFGASADDAGKKTSVFGGIADSVTASVNGLAGALKGAASALKAQAPTDTGLGVNQIQNVIGGFDAEEVRARIKGDNAELLDVLNTEQGFLEAQLQRQFVKNRPALKRAIESALLGTVNDIEAVQSKASAAAQTVRRNAEKAAADAAAAVKDREQAILSQFGIARDQQANKIAAAAQTAGLKDDITRQRQLKALVLEQIAAVKDRISIEGGRKAAIVALQAILTQVNGQLLSLAQQQQQSQKDARAALLQGTRLDIDFDQTIGNKKKEIADRKKLIAQLKVELGTVKAGTNAYKEIRNAIAEQNAAIKAITAEKQKQGQSFAAATFEFLQTQQGFASNLLGNLIPTGATAGLVGGGSVSDALSPVAGAADARSQSGPTAGQGNATNHILTLILQQLKQINGTQAAPEANRQRAGQNAIFDYQAGF